MSFANSQLSRRSFTKLTLSSLIVPGTLFPAATRGQTAQTGAETATEVTPAEWMTDWKEDRVKKLLGPLDLRRFSDPIYILLKPIGWKDLSPQNSLPKVTVPKGFVTDFASVPRPFWSLFRPDGNYAYAAVLHDYLYWEQPVKRSVADAIFRAAMEDLQVTDKAAGLLYEAVDKFGQASWDKNARLRRDGERRILTKIPEDPVMSWKEWKATPGVFDRS